MTKLSSEACDRLLNLVYTLASRETVTKLPAVRSKLYETSSQTSVLDSLTENEWKQKPINEVINDETIKKHGQFSILKFRCQNSYIISSDFHNIYPISRQRKYRLSAQLEFQVVKARNPFSMTFTGHYYLIFKNHVEAAAYLLETRHRVINGMPLALQPIRLTALDLKLMLSPFLDPSVRMENPQEDPGRMTISEIFKQSERKMDIINLLGLKNTTETDPLVQYSLLQQFIDLNLRKRTALIKNLPFGLSKFALPKVLWNYNLAPNAFTTVLSDPVKQSHLQLVRFQDSENAARFVRNFHGRRWHSVQSKKEKLLLDPLYCEFV